MGIGTSMKETSLHYYRDPLVEVLSEDQDVNLRGIIIVGSPDKNEDKYLSAGVCPGGRSRIFLQRTGK